MSSPQILFAAAGVGGGPPPPSGPAFAPAGVGFNMFGLAVIPAGVPMAPLSYIDFGGSGNIVINNFAASASGPSFWDTSGGTYAATTGVTLNLSAVAVFPIFGSPMADVVTPFAGPINLAGTYIVDGGGGGGGINSSAAMNFDLFVIASSPGDRLGLNFSGSVDLVDAATRTIMYSTASFNINMAVDFV